MLAEAVAELWFWDIALADMRIAAITGRMPRCEFISTDETRNPQQRQQQTRHCDSRGIDCETATTRVALSHNSAKREGAEREAPVGFNLRLRSAAAPSEVQMSCSGRHPRLAGREGMRRIVEFQSGLASAIVATVAGLRFDASGHDRYNERTIQRASSAQTLLSSSMAEHPAVNRRVVGSSPT